MQFFLLGILVLIGIVFLLNNFTKAKPESLVKLGKYAFATAVILLTLFLLMRGGFQFIWLGFLALIPWVRRFHMLNSIYRSYKNFRNTGAASGSSYRGDDQEKARQSKYRTEMSRDEALRILELDHEASVEDIKKAHRKLMQKHHPDHGGNEEMASLLNRAKDVLLDK